MSADDLARSLFESARRDRPAPSTRARVLAGCRSELARNRVRKQARNFAFAACAALALAAGTALLIRARSGEPVEAPTPERIAASTGSVPEIPPMPALDAVPRVKQAPSRRPAPSAAPARRALSLREEVEALDRARSQLAAGNASEALALLDEYQRGGGARRLDAEATLLRIEALSRQGRSGQASDLAQRFIAKNPSSALSERAATFVRAKDSETEHSTSGGKP